MLYEFIKSSESYRRRHVTLFIGLVVISLLVIMLCR